MDVTDHTLADSSNHVYILEAGSGQKAVLTFLTYRPHFNLKGLTPMEYIRQILAA